MSVAYHSTQLTFPLHTLKETFLYSDLDHVINDCEHYGLKCFDDAKVLFIKTDFDDNMAVVSFFVIHHFIHSSELKSISLF